MNGDHLADLIETLADGPPWDPAWLRTLLPELAVRGRLAPQDAGEEGAEALLRRARAECASRMDRGVAQKRRGSTADPVEAPFSVPFGWTWALLRDVSTDLGQVTPSSDFTYIDVSSVDGRCGRVESELQVVSGSDAPSRARKAVRRGSVIYSTVRPYLQKIAIVDLDYDPIPIASTAFAVVDPVAGIPSRYIHIWLRTGDFDSFANAHAKGAAYPAINDRDFGRALIPLPPLAEQKRIVAKVDELMGLAEVLETKHIAASSVRVRFRDAALHALAEADDDAALRRAWERLDAEFDTLFTEPEDIPPLRRTILQLAVRGRLVPQDAGEEGAEALLAQIAADREARVASGSIRPERTSSRRHRFACESIGHAGWVTAPLGIVAHIEMGQSPPSSTYNADGIGLPFYQGKAEFGEVHPQVRQWCREPNKIAEAGDVLVSVRAPVGPTNVADETCCIGRGLGAVRPLAGVPTGFLRLVLMAHERALMSQATGTTFSAIGRDVLYSLPIPLPPLAEQKRIVAKVDELMTLCDTLEARLRSAKEARESFARSIANALATDETGTAPAPDRPLPAAPRRRAMPREASAAGRAE